MKELELEYKKAPKRKGNRLCKLNEVSDTKKQASQIALENLDHLNIAGMLLLSLTKKLPSSSKRMTKIYKCHQSGGRRYRRKRQWNQKENHRRRRK